MRLSLNRKSLDQKYGKDKSGNLTIMLILLAHGSPKQQWRDSVERLAEAVDKGAGARSVLLAYMDHGPPSLAEAAATALDSGAKEIRVLPLFLTGEGHVTEDIVPMVDDLRSELPDVKIELLPAIGQHPMFREMLEQIALSGSA